MNNIIGTFQTEADIYNLLLLKYIKENNIKLLIDIHGAKSNHPFDIELGTLSNLSIDLSVQNTIIDYLKKHNINNIAINNPFKGGGITRYIFENTNIDIIQLEINRYYRDINNLQQCEKLCNALIDFAQKYTNFN